MSIAIIFFATVFAICFFVLSVIFKGIIAMLDGLVASLFYVIAAVGCSAALILIVYGIYSLSIWIMNVNWATIDFADNFKYIAFIIIMIILEIVFCIFFLSGILALAGTIIGFSIEILAFIITIIIDAVIFVIKKMGNWCIQVNDYFLDVIYTNVKKV